MLIVPDTNVLFSDPFLEKSLIMTILAAEDQTGIRLVIPEVVVDELRNHVEERLDATVKAVDRARRQYAGLRGVEPFSVHLMIHADQRQAVLDRFERRIQQLDKEGRILPYPSPSPRELAHRSIRVQLPFLDKDRGMRDTLIWLTTKECAIKGVCSGTRVTLVSDDGAFWDKDKRKMKEGLMAELEDAGIPPDSIAVRPALQDVIHTFVSALPPAEWVRVAIQGGQIDDFTASSDTVLLKATDWILDNPEILEVGGAYIFVEFDIVEEVVLQSIEQAIEIGGGQALVESNWTCDVAAEGYDNPHFGDNLRIALEFKLNSIVNIEEDSLSVRSHEVTDVEVVHVSETRPAGDPDDLGN